LNKVHDFMGIIILFLGTLLFNSCLRELQKLNCYNHVFFKYLQVFELNLKFLVVFLKRFKYLKISDMFLQIFGIFLKHLNIDVMNILTQFFWLIKIVL
jgi:hypothetical protein